MDDISSFRAAWNFLKFFIVILIYSGIADGEIGHVCEGSMFHIECPAGQLVSVFSALYGRKTSELCTSWPIRTTDCSAANSVDVVRQRCKGRQTCDIEANNGVFGDPCGGTLKYLQIDYLCEGAEIDHVCEGSTFHIECPAGQMVSVFSALYGRKTSELCTSGPIRTTNCSAANSLDVVRQRCKGRQTCDIEASNGVFGDPCGGTFKYLQIEFSCEDVAAQTDGCFRPPTSPGVLQFDESQVELNQTTNVFFEIGSTLTFVCEDPGQQRLTSPSTERVCAIFRQWLGEEPVCEPVPERIVIDGDYINKQVISDSTISITLSSTTSYVEILCIVAEGNPKLSSPHIDDSDSRVENVSRRVGGATSGRPMAKGLSLNPPLVTNSGTFGCRSQQKGGKESHEVDIVFQLSSDSYALDCPNNITVSTEPGENVAHVYWPIPTLPNGYGMVSSHQPGDEFGIGSTRVQLVATTSTSDNDLECVFIVTILDEEKPQIIYCPEDIIQAIPPGQTSVHVSWSPPDAVDNSGVVSFKPSVGSAEGTFPIGKTDMVYEVSDSYGNVAYCNFTISIRDDEPPVITNCPRDISISVTDATLRDVIVTWIEPNTTDNSGDFGVNSTSVPGESFPFGVSLVSYVARDSAGNEDFCDFFVTVNDGVAPWFIDCPDDIIQYKGKMYGSVVNWDEPTAMDNVGLVGVIHESHLPGDFFLEGMHRIQYVVQDGAGNEGRCEFNITVATAMCPSVQTNISEMVLSWETTPIDRVALSVERCSVYTTNAGLPRSQRECKLNKTSQSAEWLQPEIESCGESRDTVEIIDLMLIEVVESNVEEVAETTADVTFNTTQLENDDIESVAETLENIADVESNSVQVTEAVVKTIDNVLDGVDENELDDKDALAASKIIRSLEKQVTTTLASEGNFEATEPRVAVRTVEVKSQEISRDITFVSFRDEVVEDVNGYLQVNQIETVIDDDSLRARNVDTSIKLPKEVNKRSIGHFNEPDSNVHFSFILFQSDRLFRSKRLQTMRESNRNVSTSGRVISATVDGPAVANLTEPVVIEFSPHQVWNESTGTGRAECVYWDFALEGGVGDWANDGCDYVGINDGRLVCHCTHLTSFAVLMDMNGNPADGIRGFVLDFISKLGCILSIAGLILSLATLLALRSLRSSRSRQILIQLCFSLLFLYVVFLGGIEATSNQTFCLIIAALLHYFTLTTLAWMAVEARNMYLLLVRVFKGTESKFMLKACFFAWGAPVVIVIGSVILTAYLLQLDEYYSQHHCFLRPGYSLYYGLMLPIGLILIHNFIMFGLVVKSLLPSNLRSKNGTMDRKGKSEQVISRLQNALVMSVLLGLTWSFGFLAIDGATFLFQLLFCIFNSIQGLLVFLLFCLRSQDVRKAWKAYFPKCNINGESYKVKESSYGYHLRGSDAHAWHGPMALSPEDGQGLEYYMYTNNQRPTSNGPDMRYAYTSQISSSSTTNTRISIFSSNSVDQ